MRRALKELNLSERIRCRPADLIPNELAAIPITHDPWTDPRYAAYRIQMLRWWATTDEYNKLK